MIETGINKGIHKVYYLVKLSLYGWFITLMGGMILGIGPALLALAETYLDSPWDHTAIRWRESFKALKRYFRQGNLYFFSYASAILLVYLSLHTAVQLKGMYFFMSSFILFFLAIMLVVSSLLTLSILSYYEIKLLNALKLSLILFFTQWRIALTLMIVLVTAVYLTFKLPVFLLFVTVGVVVISSKIIQKVLNQLILK